MAIKISPISAAGYQILSSRYDALDPDNAEFTKENLDFHFSASEPRVQGSGEHRLEAVLSVRSIPTDEKETTCRIEVKVRGIFLAMRPDNDEPFERFDLFMRVNAFNLLYAFIRSHVQLLTSMTPSNQVCLPCLDVASIAEFLSAEPPSGDDGVGQS
jgi:preprotein translocase subunit SecB